MVVPLVAAGIAAAGIGGGYLTKQQFDQNPGGGPIDIIGGALSGGGGGGQQQNPTPPATGGSGGGGGLLGNLGTLTIGILIIVAVVVLR